jgi:uncharacterized protein GlcG (DUF336 family)
MIVAALFALRTAPAAAAPCGIGDNILAALQNASYAAVNGNNGGFFSPDLMWLAIVDRQGRLCLAVKTGDAWPGSRAIAMAKAATANDFSNRNLALSTANLYGFVQPGGSLFGLNDSNPFNPNAEDPAFPQNALGHVNGGIITFGGGVALYAGGEVIGGLGVSGDTSCADHVVAYNTRKAVINSHLLGQTPGGAGADNIKYAPNGMSTVNTNLHPHCLPSDVTPAN